ncbi:MAG: lycopene cyclase domain-containing protein [Ignavibacteria bacterium]
MEYTYAAVASVIVVVCADRLLKTHLVHQARFWIFIGIMFAFKTIVNGYLTWRPIVLYGESFQIALRIGTIPVEDYLFGFSLITSSIILWEWWKSR